MTIIEKIQAILGPTGMGGRKLSTLSALVEICKEEATDYCNLDEYTEKLDNAVVQMVLERYNRINNEGIDSTNASGIHETFHDGYTASTTKMLQKHRRMKTFDNGLNNNGFNGSCGCGGIW